MQIQLTFPTVKTAKEKRTSLLRVLVQGETLGDSPLPFCFFKYSTISIYAFWKQKNIYNSSS